MILDMDVSRGNKKIDGPPQTQSFCNNTYLPVAAEGVTEPTSTQGTLDPAAKASKRGRCRGLHHVSSWSQP